MASSTPHGPVAFYLAGSEDGSRKGTYFVNTTDVKASAKYDMMALSLHEGLPGHHLQLALAAENANYPPFRRYMEDMKYSDCPSRFPMYTAYAEGWGLYSEALGEEMGLYEDPYSLFGRYSCEVYRACRLVVDTGLHAFGWSRQRAIDYMAENTGLTMVAIENEIDRYITWPGQACAYKIGEIKIWELRRKAEKALGENFDVRKFHTVILDCGGCPLTFLEKKVDKFISDAGKK